MAISSSLAILQRIAPTLYVDAGVQDWLDLADQQLGTTDWGAVRIQAVAYLAAHQWTLAQREIAALAAGSSGGPVGAMTARSAGDLSESYGSALSSPSGSVSASDMEYTTTTYGLRFLALRNSRPCSMPFLVDTDMA